MQHKVVTFGEIMLRLATPGFLRFNQTTELEATFGGGEANVAVSLTNYGIPAAFVTALPKNDLGEYAVSTLKFHDVDTSHIVRSGDRVGIYFLESGAVSRGSKVIYDRANSSFAKMKKGSVDWDRAFEGATWFHWTGITPAVSEGAAEVCLEACEAAAKKGITIQDGLSLGRDNGEGPRQ
jgi:2-dehydro-3-deoxygluconokinase